MKIFLIAVLILLGHNSFSQLSINEYTCYRKNLDINGYHKDIKLGALLQTFKIDSLSPEQDCEIPFGTNLNVKCYSLLSYSEEKYKIAESEPYKIGLFFFNDSLIMIEMEFQGLGPIYSYANSYGAEDCIEKRTDYNEKTVEATFSLQGDIIYLNTTFKKLSADDAIGFCTVRIFNKKIMKKIAKPVEKNGDY